MVQERRFIKVSQVRTSRGGKGISGYGAVFNQLSEDLGGFREIVKPGAFKRCLGSNPDVRCLGSNPDVRCLFNHNPDAVLGRTKAGTLRLSEDRTGLYFDCDLPDTQAGRDVRESVTRGDVDQCSFGFVVQGQNWREENDGNGDTQTIRELTDVDLFDVSPVTYPAYPQTSVSARLLWPEGEPPEVRKRLSTARSVTIPPKTSPVSAAVQEPPARSKYDGWTDAERLADINQRLGVPVFKSKMVRSHQTMKSNHSPMSAKESAELRRFLATGKHEQRDLTTGGTAGAFIPETFNGMVFAGMRAYDAIFDPAFSAPLETDTGGPIDVFAIDDGQAAATIVGEGVTDSEVDPNNLFKVTLAQAPAWDSGLVKASLAFVQDSGPNLPELLAQSFAVRLARGIAPSLITALVGAANLGATATGDQNSATPSGVTQIGYQDLIALRKSVDPAYRASGKCGWLLNDNTLAALDGLIDKNGRPIIHPVYVNGQRILLGYPVGICPSLPNIGHSNKPILFGALGYFVVRTVKGEGQLIRLTENPGLIENLKVGFKSFMRCNGALLAAQAGSPAGAGSPVQYLQNA